MRFGRLPSAIAAISMLGLVAGCGASGDAGSEGGSDGLTTLTVGVSSIGDLAPIYLGQEQGYFGEEGIELELQPQQGGAVTVTGVVSGDFQVGYSNTTSLLVANVKGLPLRALAPAAQVGTDPSSEDYTAIMVREDSPIEDVQDLAGKTLAANTLESQTDSTVKAALEAEGVDPSSVTFTEIPFPEQVAALEEGQVDAITPIEPFVTQGEDAGMRTILSGYFATGIPNYTTGAYFTTARYLEENPEIADGLRRAIHRSLEYAQSHEAEVREIIPSFTEVDPDLAERIRLPIFAAEFDRESIDRLADLIVKYGLTDERPDVDTVLEGTA